MYGRRLVEDFHGLTAREFEALLNGLTTEPNSRVARYFKLKSESGASPT